MYIIRDVLQCKPGRAKDLVSKFKSAVPHMQKLGWGNFRIMTDAVATYWTVILEIEVDRPQAYWDTMEQMPNVPEVQEALKGYMDLVVGGHREMFRVE